jgi:hypothetical protein
MDQFGYLSVLLSIIVGFSITQILFGFRGVVLSRGHVKIYWPTLVWGVMLMLINVQSWWAMFGLRELQHWTFPQFGVVLMQTIGQYMLAAIVFPDFSGSETIDLRKHYWRHARWFFGLLVLLLAVSLTKDLVISGRFPGGLNLLFHIGFMTTCAVAMLAASETYHKLLSLLGIATFAVYTVALFTVLR